MSQAVQTESFPGKQSPALAGKKLLIVVNEPAFFVSHRLELALAAERAGMRVTVTTPVEERTKDILESGLNYIPLEINRWSSNPIDDLRYTARLIRLYRQERPDIIHHVSIKPVIYGSIAARIVGAPAVVNAVSGLGYVFISKGLGASLRRTVVRFLYRRAFRHPNCTIIVQNPDDLALFLKNKLAAEDKFTTIRGSGVDTERFKPTDEAPGPPLVVLPARLLKEKGIAEFVEAASQLKRKGVDACFALIGDRPDGNPGAVASADYERWKREAHVEFWGYREDMPEVYRQAHIVCLPSYREGLPKSLIEAAAAGRAIVTTDTPGCREIVEHERNGLLIPVRDSDSLASALEQLIEDTALRGQFGQAGSEVVNRGGFSEGVVFKQTFQAYEYLLASAGRSV